MHRDLCQHLLAQEVAAANRGHLRGRLAADVLLDGTTAVVDVQAPDGRHLLALSGDNYNAEPLDLMAIDRTTREPLAEAGWPARLLFGSPHPVTQRPFCCVRGLAAYYIHPSHLEERWDRDRAGRRLDVLLGHLLDRMEVPA